MKTKFLVAAALMASMGDSVRLGLVIFLTTFSCLAIEPMKYAPFMGRTQVETPSLFLNFLTNFSTSTDTTLYTSPVFTPTSNALLVVAAIISQASSIAGFDNIGSTNLTWWKATGNNNVGSMSSGIFISQMPIGTTPGALQFRVSTAAGTGCEMHIWEVTNANTTSLWGTNAVVQAGSTASGAGNPTTVTFTAPATGGNLFYVTAQSASTVGVAFTPESPWQFLRENGHVSPTQRLMAYQRTNIPASTASVVFTNTSTITVNQCWIEIKK